MTTLGYEKSPGGLYLPVQGPEDHHPKKIKVPIRNGKVFPDGACMAYSAIIGASREVAERHFRKLNREPEFVEIP